MAKQAKQDSQKQAEQGSKQKLPLFQKWSLEVFYLDILWFLKPRLYIEPLQRIDPDLWKRALQLQAEYRDDTQRLVNELKRLHPRWVQWVKSESARENLPCPLFNELLYDPSSPIYQPIEAFITFWKLPASARSGLIHCIARNILDVVSEIGIAFAVRMSEPLLRPLLPPPELPLYDPLQETREEYRQKVEQVANKYIRLQEECYEGWRRLYDYPSLQEWRHHPGKHPRYLYRLAWQVYFHLHHHLEWTPLAKLISTLEAKFVQLVYQTMAQYENWRAVQQQDSPELQRLYPNYGQLLQFLTEVLGWEGFAPLEFLSLLGASDQMEDWAIKDLKWIGISGRRSDYTPQNMLLTTSNAIKIMGIPCET
jgi:hypothetical protein